MEWEDVAQNKTERIKIWNPVGMMTREKLERAEITKGGEKVKRHMVVERSQCKLRRQDKSLMHLQSVLTT